MTSSLCRGIGVAGHGVEQGAERQCPGDVPEEHLGLIACAVLSTWLPVSPSSWWTKHGDMRWLTGLAFYFASTFFSFRCFIRASTTMACSDFAPDHIAEDKCGAGKRILPDSCAGPCESVVVYAPVDAAVVRRVIMGTIRRRGVGVIFYATQKPRKQKRVQYHENKIKLNS
jgi:hypothetical protein